MNTQQRPVFQAVLKYRYPITAIASVLHRISGVILFLFIPLLLWTLQKSLVSATDFQTVQNALNKPYLLVLIGITLVALIYHLLAGIRHLLMDIGFAESMKGGRTTAYTVIALTVILIIVAGVWLL